MVWKAENYDFGFDESFDVLSGKDTIHLVDAYGISESSEDETPLPDNVIEIKLQPQKGPQTEFLSTTADIAIYGGAAGGGKSFALLLEPLRHFNNNKFGGVIFRRNSTQVRNEGGLWHESMQLYAPLGAHPREAFLDWTFPSGARVKFGHLEHERSVHDWHGSQIPFIGFDELTHFTRRQFFYMLTRNRSASGVPGYMRATCNPDADSWVRELIDWYIDKDGYAIAERSGVIRWFIVRDEKMIWADTKEDLEMLYGKDSKPKSFTFIPSKIFDNKILLEKDPTYLASLKAQNLVDKMRLLGDEEKGGNWNIRFTAGSMFRREWFTLVDEIPSGWVRAVRFWDRAATKPHADNPDPDWTRGLKMLKYPDGSYLVTDLRSMRDSPGMVEKLVKAVANHDTSSVKIVSQQDPGSAGVAETSYFTKMLSGFEVGVMKSTKNKLVRAKPVSAQSLAGNIFVLRAPWNNDFFTELENFPEGLHDDIVDVLSGAFNELSDGESILDVL